MQMLNRTSVYRTELHARFSPSQTASMWKIIRRVLWAVSIGLLAMASSLSAHGQTIFWTNWTSGVAGPAGSAVGTIAIGPTNIAVNYTGEIQFIQTNGGTNYWNPSSPYISATVANAPPDPDIITKTLTFSQPVDSLLFAVVSLNGNGYRFNRDFDILSYGQGYWGNGTLTKQSLGGGIYELDGSGEPHGVIQFKGAASSITWTSLTAENWNGFTIGTRGLVPEPSPVAIIGIGAGVLGIGSLLRRRVRKTVS
jgi:hypothetical protein